MPGNEIALDLGTASILIYIRGKGIVLREPSVIAYDKTKNKVLAVGEKARLMLGRTPDNIVAVRPLRDGVISDYDLTTEMLKYFIKQVSNGFILKPKIMICVPAMITEVEERAVYDAAISAGASKVYLIEEPVAAAIGSGIKIEKANGNMVVDIGGGTTDIAVLSLDDIVVSKSVKVAGDKFDEAIIKYIRKKYNVLIGERMAENLKTTIGCVYKRDEDLKMTVKGRSLTTGLPQSLEITSEETREAFKDVARAIVDAVKNVLETTPPELIGDIYTNGMIMTGGGSLINGLDKLLHERTGVQVTIADDPITCVARGTGTALENLSSIPDGLLYIAKNHRKAENYKRMNKQKTQR